MPRFRLRTFLIVITAFCLLLGWRVAAVESVERPIRELERLGWEVSYNLKIIGFSNPGGPIFEDIPRRSYWQKILMGYRKYDLPDMVTFQNDGEPPAKLGQILDRSILLINRLPTISDISLVGPQVSAENLLSLERVKHIRVLDLSDLSIGNEGVPALCRLSQLKELYIWGTNISEHAVTTIQKRLPDCEVLNDYN